jgi:hypothetical protein
MLPSISSSLGLTYLALTFGFSIYSFFWLFSLLSSSTTYSFWATSDLLSDFAFFYFDKIFPLSFSSLTFSLDFDFEGYFNFSS